MKKQTKVLTIISSAMILLGFILFLTGLLNGGKGVYIDKQGIHLDNSQTDWQKENVSLAPFSAIKSDCSFIDIEFIPSDKYAIEINNQLSNGRVLYQVENGTLVLKQNPSNPKFFINFNFHFNSQSDVKVYFPKETNFTEINLLLENGNIELKQMNSKNTILQVDFGNINLAQLNAETLKANLTNGNLSADGIKSGSTDVQNQFGTINMKHVEANTLNVDAKNGGIKTENVAANHAVLKSEFGNINATQFKSKGLELEGQNADMKLQGEFTGTTRVKTAFGNVRMQTALQKTFYDYNLSSHFGNISVDGQNVNNSASQQNNQPNRLDITSENGNVDVIFGK